MNSYDNSLVNILNRIKLDLLSDCVNDGDFVYWQTLSSDENGFLEYRVNDDFYSGNAGILFFLLECHEFFKNDDLIPIIRKVSYGILHRQSVTPLKQFSYFTGVTGIVYVLLRASLTLNDEHLEKNSLKLILNFKPYLDSNPLCEFLNGVAGCLYGFLMIHSIIDISFLKSNIGDCFKYLVNNSKIHKCGLYWDRTIGQSKPLCGFSHGNSGIAFALTSLGAFTNNKMFCWLAKQGFLYENQFYNSSNYNWPDFRKSFSGSLYDNYFSEFLNGNKEFFNDFTYMTAWCHGSPGIGIAHLFSFIKTKNVDNLRNVQNSIKSTVNHFIDYNINQKNKNFTICHGTAGNMLFLLEVFHKLSINSCIIYINKFLELLKESNGIFPSGFPKGQNMVDFSLFNGSTGIGYFILKYLNFNNVESLFCVNSGTIGCLNDFFSIKNGFSIRNIIDLIFEKNFPRSHKDINIEKSSSFSFNLENIFNSNSKNNVFLFELERIQFDLAINTVYENFREKVNERYINQLVEKLGDFSLINFKLSSEIKVVRSPDNQSDIFIWIPSKYGILEIQVSDHLLLILESFQSICNIDSSFGVFLDNFFKLELENIVSLKVTYFTFVRYFISIGVLIPQIE